ncbi:hypothetical protein K1719_037468 [Acacia pycnantha]|nr:hypothetical protein K1719_037468 [Acacia pycnantha]
MIATLKPARADDEEELKSLASERDMIKAEGEASSSTLAAKIARLQGLLQESVEEAFKNSLAQIQVLNPGSSLTPRAIISNPTLRAISLSPLWSPRLPLRPVWMAMHPG